MIEMWQLWVGGACRYGQNVFNASTDGVCQETCRDFGHMQMGMDIMMMGVEGMPIT